MSTPAKLAPGVYRGLKDEVYHSDCATALSFSASNFKTMALESAAHFFESHWLNPLYTKPDTKPMGFGRAAHALMLGEPAFNEKFAISPFAEFRTDESKEWRDIVAAGKTVIKPRDMDTISAMCDVLRKSPQTARAFTNGDAELTYIWEPQQSLWPRKEYKPILLKSRPDWSPSKPDGVALEYKTAESAHPDDWEKAFFNYGYDIQAALICEALKTHHGKDVALGHVVQEKAPPYVVQVYIVTEKHLEIGRRRFRRGLEILKPALQAHLAGRPRHEAWPGYFTKPVPFGIPAWVENKESEH